jgi:uncharacterized protein YhaN
MRIERLIIDGFGHFAGEELGPFEKNVVVFQGANEAGKSTLLAFIQTVLFGFGRRPGLTDVPALSGGDHGGRIVAVDHDGRNITVERHAGPHGGRLRLWMPDGTTGGHDELNRLIGIPPEVYCNVFSFDLEQLYRASSLNNDDIKTHLYGAGLGTENLPLAMRNLEQRSAAIFLARGRVQQIPTLLNELAAIDGKLDQAAREAQQYHNHQARLDAITTEYESIRQQLFGVRREQAHTRNLLNAMDDWLALKTDEARLESLPEIESFPENGVARLVDIETQMRAAVIEESRALQAYEDLHGALEQPVPDAVLEECRLDIEQLRDQLAGFNDWIARQPRLAADVASVQQQLDEGLGELGRGWSVERLMRFDTSVPERDAVARHDAELESARQAVRDSQRDLDTAAAEHRTAADALTLAEEGLASGRALGASRAELEQWQQAYREAREAWADLDSRRQRYEERQRQAAYGSPPAPAGGGGSARSCSMIAAGGLMLFGALSAIIGLAAGGAPMAAGLILGVTALGLGIALLLRGLRPPPSSDGSMSVSESSIAQSPLQQAQAEFESSQARAREAFQRLGVADSSQSASALEDIQERISITRGVLQQIDGVSDQLRMRQRHLDDAGELLERAQQVLLTAWSAWRAWLVARELPEDLSPDAVRTIFDRVIQLRQAHERLIALAQERDNLAAEIDAYCARYGAVVQVLGEASVGSVHEIGASARLLIERYEAARTALERRKLLQDQFRGASRDHEERKNELAALRRQHTDLLAHGCSDDSEAFRTRARQFSDRQEAQQTRQEILARLQRASGTGEDWLCFRAELDQAATEELQSRGEDIERQVEELERTQSALDVERGELTQEMSRLAGDETAVALRSERQVVEEQLREAAAEWSTYTVAREILARARQRYEQERQPEVLQTAERFFRTITAGRYTGVISPIGSNKIEVVRADERRLTEDHLSRGTREQLYLSLRFGLISGFGSTSAHLPVIVDDILVNFDPARARATAQAFAELSQTNQILIFTCHPSTVEHFRAVSPDVQVVDLQRDSIAALR